MRLSTIQLTRDESHAAVQDAGERVLLDAPDVSALLSASAWRAEAESALVDVTRARISNDSAERAMILPLPSPAKVICCGLNYQDHIAETGRETPEYPTLFGKYADTLTGPRTAITIDSSTKVDWEAELAVVIGATVRSATPVQAREAILGYTVANDVSLRDWQSRTLQWMQGKVWEHTTPLGPTIVTADAISPTDGLAIRTLINGEVVQESNTRELLFTSEFLVSYISQFTTLRPGDIILTGTPGGVGLGRTPARWLQDGDVLTTTIEGIGELHNTLNITTPASTAQANS